MKPRSSANNFTMAELVLRTGVPAATVRYYFAEHLLPPPVRVSANRFLYNERHAEAIRLIRLLRDRRGLSLEAIGQLLPDLLPDLLGKPEGGVFRSEMWGNVIATSSRRIAGPSVADRLVAAGLEAFGQRGYADVTVDEVCQTTAIAKGSFYRHFASKEELFFAVAKEAGKMIAARFAREVADKKISRNEAVVVLARALAPYVAIVLDLSAHAARQRAGHMSALQDFTALIDGATSLMGGRPGGERIEAMLGTAVFLAVRDLVDRGIEISKPNGLTVTAQAN